MNAGAVGIIYDGDGNRVSKTVMANGVPTTTYYLVDDLNPTGYPQVVDELQSGVVIRQYTYGLQRIDEVQMLNGAWTPSFYGYDGGGNVRQLTSAAGIVTDLFEYDAFGNSFAVSGNTSNNYLYRGEQWDPDLGLYYLRARYYNSLTGRFMSRDPKPGQFTIPGSLHKYFYANANPVSKADPTGREAEEEEGALYEREIDTADELLSRSAPNDGLEVHHLFPQSLDCLFNMEAGEILAIAISTEDHDFYDGEWNDWWGELFGYHTPRSCAAELVTLEEVFDAAEQIYANEPDILEAIENWKQAISQQGAQGLL